MMNTMSFLKVTRKEDDGLLKTAALKATAIYYSSYVSVWAIRGMQKAIDPKKVELYHNHQHRAYEKSDRLMKTSPRKNNKKGDQEGPAVYSLSFDRSHLTIDVAREAADNSPPVPVSQHKLPIESLVSIKFHQGKLICARDREYKVKFTFDCTASSDPCNPAVEPLPHRHQLKVYMAQPTQNRLLQYLHVFGMLDPKGVSMRGAAFSVALVPHLDYVTLGKRITQLEKQMDAKEVSRKDKTENEVDEVVAMFDPLALN